MKKLGISQYIDTLSPSSSAWLEPASNLVRMESSGSLAVCAADRTALPILSCSEIHSLMDWVCFSMGWRSANSSSLTWVTRDRNRIRTWQRLKKMRTSKVIHVVGCHAEGEVGDVIVGGVAPPGDTIWEQRFGKVWIMAIWVSRTHKVGRLEIDPHRVLEGRQQPKNVKKLISVS